MKNENKTISEEELNEMNTLRVENNCMVFDKSTSLESFVDTEEGR